MLNKFTTCRICGHKYDDFYPWGKDGKTASFEICDCCGVTFGYEDATKKAAIEFRKIWIDNGAKWHNCSVQPKGWSFEKSLREVPSEFKE